MLLPLFSLILSFLIKEVVDDFVSLMFYYLAKLCCCCLLSWIANQFYSVTKLPTLLRHEDLDLFAILRIDNVKHGFFCRSEIVPMYDLIF